MKNSIINNAKFELGKVFNTQRVMGDIFNSEDFGKFCLKSLQRHEMGDWGDMPEEDKISNDEALKNEGRIFSGYNVPEDMNANGSKIWIITEWNREATTILFPSEY